MCLQGTTVPGRLPSEFCAWDSGWEVKLAKLEQNLAKLEKSWPTKILPSSSWSQSKSLTQPGTRSTIILNPIYKL